MRTCGVLLPITSLPSKYGIGCFSREAYEFVDKLKAAGQKNWQILPLGPTGYGDSPYQSFSTFAGNPYYIDLEQLIEEGLLTEEECEACDFGDNDRYVDYEKIYFGRFPILRKAFERFVPDEEFAGFCEENAYWLEDYSLYMAVKDANGGKSWIEWEEGLRNRQPEALEQAREELKDDIAFYRFQQYEFMKQWTALKSYANDQGIRIIGDIPIYVAFDGADTWANPEMFQFTEENLPSAVAGCPPDAFSATGQLWGNPLYKWEYHKKQGYEWWMRRVKYCFELYDIVRIDHFRGFDAYYSIPYGDKTAENGHWEEGPGYDLFRTMKEKLGDLPIIAEDLGFLTDSVMKLLKDTGYPGMKVLQFAFDSRDESDYQPHLYTNNCVVYTGTHDNDTVLGWDEAISDADRTYAREYMRNEGSEGEQLAWDFICTALRSVADMAIIPIQDYLALGSEARINTPSTLGDNWKWRMLPEEFTDELAKRMRRAAKLYGRIRE